MSTCVQTITVQDTTAPAITCPADTTVDCSASTLPSATGTATATDNCSGVASITYSDSTTAGNCAGNYVITRTWKATDNCGNMSTCVQTITVQDTTGPAITCPSDTTVDCGDSTDPADTGEATATDDCSGVASITYSDSIAAGSCAGNYVITRTWTATDSCGNASSCVQTITVQDTTPPVISCPNDIEDVVTAAGECSASVNVGTATATDDCSGVQSILGVRSDSLPLTDPYPVGTTTITWTATDNCGNVSETCTQTITVKGTPLLDPIGDQTVDYSDCLSIDISAFDCDHSGGDLSYTATGLPANLTLTDNGNGTATISGQANVPAGTYPVTVTVTDPGGLFHSRTFNIEVKKEKTEIEFDPLTTDSFVYTAGPNINTAPVRLSVNLTPEDDNSDCCTSTCEGDISLAKVRFELFKSGNMSNTPDIVINNVPVDSNGYATTIKSLAAGSNGMGETYRVVAKVEPANSYWREIQVAETCVTVDYGSTEKRVTGGGWIPLSISANGKSNFGFTVNHRRNGTPKGNSIYLFRGTDGYNYLVKSNSWNSGGLTFYSDPTKARFSGRCVIQKIDRATGMVVDSIGNCRFTVDIVDGERGNPRRADMYAISVWLPDGSLWHQAGTASAPIPLGGGNVTIHNSANSR